jgi:outer membrane lipoprotein-sorting protein
MTRRDLLVLLAATGPLAAIRPAQAAAAAPAFVPTAQDTADLARVEAYLNGLTTLKAKFQQIAPDGAISRGIAWMDRPGRMRFQYDPPTPLLLVAGGGLFVFYDRELNQTTNIPLGSTPLGILLGENLRLSGEVTVTAIDREPGVLSITMQRTASPGDGSLTLIFSDGPLLLRQWVVVDAQRQETRVSLFDVQLGGTFDQQMFHFIDPRFMPSEAKRTYQ